MKKIEFIAPVKSMRGNFGSRQSLVYAPNDNRAFDSIPGQLNPALNYEPRLIGARGKRNYFCVKTKSSVRLTTPAINAMASLGGVGAIYSALVRNKMTQVYVDAYACYQDALASGFVGTFRKYMYGFIKQALEDKSQVISIVTADHSVSIDNPWYNRSIYSDFCNSFDKNILRKFFKEFWTNQYGSTYTFTFYLNSKKYVMGQESTTSGSVFNNEFYNGFILEIDDLHENYIIINLDHSVAELHDENGDLVYEIVPNGVYFT